MNYIAEINSFNNWLLENPLNSSEQALWYRLMAYANQLGWKSEFSIANTRLCDDLRVTRQHLDKCRSTLINKGLLSYKKGNGNQCGTYHLNSFISVDTVVDTIVDTVVAQECQGSLPLNKLNKTKQNETKVKKESVKKKFGEYQNVLLTEKEYQSLNSDFPNTPELIKFLDEYIEMKGYKAKSHYLAIRKWVKGAVDERKPKQRMQYTNPFQMTEEQKMADRERQKKMLQEAIDRGDFDVKHGRYV